MNDSERTALVDELAEAIHAADEHNGHMHYARKHAHAIMPIIDRLIAERDIDALLDSVHPYALISGMWNPPAGMRDDIVEISWPNDDPDYDWRIEIGTGPTRMDALRDAVAKAKGAGNE